MGRISELFSQEKHVEVIEEARILLQQSELLLHDCILAVKAALKLRREHDVRDFVSFAINQAPDDPWLNYQYARSMYIAKNYDKAIKYYKKTVSLNPSNINAFFALGSIYAKLGKYKDASRFYEEAISLSDGNYYIMNKVVTCLVNGSEYQKAYEYCQKIPDEEKTLPVKAICAELMRDRTLSSGIGEAFYDIIYAESDSYAVPARESAYLPVWKEVVRILRERGATHILDLGCGPGQFAEFLEEEMPGMKYCGIDFSAEAIRIAKRRAPYQLFEKRRIPLENWREYDQYDHVISLEVLEHIDNDLEVIENIPVGKYAIFSVPNFDSLAHVRYFRNAQEVEERYRKFLSGWNISEIPLGKDSILWVFHGTRNG